MKKLKHLAIIVDGNGRWAKERGKSRSEGHKKGAENLEVLIKHIANNTDIEFLSLYVFSTENFKREAKEVNYLMNLFVFWFDRVMDVYKNSNIKIIFSGSSENLNKKVLDKMRKLEDYTKDNTGLVLNFCLNYGGRKEIVDTTKKLVKMVQDGKISVDDIDEDIFSNNLYNNIPDVDFMIRTSGEQRLSNFLLWEISYAELCFTPTYFPALTIEELDKLIDSYNNRDRRFGGINK